MGLFLITFFFFALIFTAMAIGFIVQGKCLQGSCGGEALYGPNGELLNCDDCPNRKEKEARART